MPRHPEQTRSLVQRVEEQLVPLDMYLKAGTDFDAAVPRMAAALACSDGDVTLAEYVAMSELISLCGSSPVVAVAMMSAARSPLTVKQAAAALQAAAAVVSQTRRDAAWTLLKPLLHLQGDKAADLGRTLADALRIDEADRDLQGLAQQPPLVDWLVDTLRKLGPADKELLKVRQLAEASGDLTLRQALYEYQQSGGDAAKLMAQAAMTTKAMSELLQPARDKLEIGKQYEQAKQQAEQMAEALRKQVMQRLGVVEARLQHERTTLAEDIREAVHDAGESLELSLLDRMRTDDPSDPRVWASAARQTFGKDMERRIDRLVRRRTDVLQLLTEELRVFQESVELTRLTRRSIEHHAVLARVMPSMRIATRALHTADKAASLGLGVSGLTAAGAGAAVYTMGAAAIFPVIMPALPVIAGVAVVSFLFKWFTDKENWKVDEIRHMRGAFEKELRGQLDVHSQWFHQELVRIEQGFTQAAQAMLQPVLLDAQATVRVVEAQQRLLDDVTTRCRKAQLLLPAPAATQ